MDAIADHRHVDLGVAVEIVDASLATGQTMTSDGYFDLIDTLILFNDLVDFRGDTWRSQKKTLSFVEYAVASARTWTASCLDAFEALQL